MRPSALIPPQRYFAYLTWTDIEALPDKDKTIIIQPLGSIEQHGPHLPLVVDAAISEGVLGKALQTLGAEIPAYVLPTLYYGKSNEHMGFPGVITLSAETLLVILKEVAASLYQSGFRKWILLNSHGGQIQVLEIAARDLHQIYPDLQIFPFFTWRMPHCAADLLTPKEMTHGIHAGDGETSLMMALWPELVREDRLVKEFPQGIPADGELLSMEGSLPFAWLTKEVSRSGVMGDATVATKEKGEVLLDCLADGCRQAIEAVYHFQPPSLNRKG
ncbi:creatininase family protein [Synechocystis sp. CACIAM 05]|uniref:creatininase family protein n=1 Tax=Synechocystis sp. CACIAM 05 TaxID=1933929 RepID=UPI00138E65E2|nr:creatininase family protein [Synechocystis sp. CACIAM 05]QHV01557.1 creatinine amidohydrolase [Synechocystis sp. CACIAM 05]